MFFEAHAQDVCAAERVPMLSLQADVPAQPAPAGQEEDPWGAAFRAKMGAIMGEHGPPLPCQQAVPWCWLSCSG